MINTPVRASHPSSPYHCNNCYQNGFKVAAYGTQFTFKNSNHIWFETFPCYKSAQDFIKALAPFLEGYAIDNIKVFSK